MIPYISLLVSCALVAFQSVMLMRTGQRLIVLESLLRDRVNRRSTVDGDELESNIAPPKDNRSGTSIDRRHPSGS